MDKNNPVLVGVIIMAYGIWMFVDLGALEAGDKSRVRLPLAIAPIYKLFGRIGVLAAAAVPAVYFICLGTIR